VAVEVAVAVAVSVAAALFKPLCYKKYYHEKRDSQDEQLVIKPPLVALQPSFNPARATPKNHVATPLNIVRHLLNSKVVCPTPEKRPIRPVHLVAITSARLSSLLLESAEHYVYLSIILILFSQRSDPAYRGRPHLGHR
ncbi:MAG: hypothetical protein QNL48_08745, partial [Alcaligenes aquatilis]